VSRPARLPKATRQDAPRGDAKVLGINLPAGLLAKASLPSADAMNGTERRYASEVLEVQRLAGEVLWWGFQSIKLRLADQTWYTPDFPVVLADCTLEFHEVKGGFIRDDAMVKLKVAAEDHPFRFVLAQRRRREWEITRYQAERR
jgi:hypothetical protein